APVTPAGAYPAPQSTPARAPQALPYRPQTAPEAPQPAYAPQTAPVTPAGAYPAPQSTPARAPQAMPYRPQTAKAESPTRMPTRSGGAADETTLHRRVWSQTVPQPSPLAQSVPLPPASPAADDPPFVPQTLPMPTVIRRERRATPPETPPDGAAAGYDPAPSEPARRRRAAAYPGRDDDRGLGLNDLLPDAKGAAKRGQPAASRGTPAAAPQGLTDAETLFPTGTAAAQAAFSSVQGTANAGQNDPATTAFPQAAPASTPPASSAPQRPGGASAPPDRPAGAQAQPASPGATVATAQTVGNRTPDSTLQTETQTGGMAFPTPAGAGRGRPSSWDAADDDSGRYAPLPNTPNAEPVPVPTFGPQAAPPPHRHRKRRAWLSVLVTVLLLAAVGFALYQSGLWARLAGYLGVSGVAVDSGVPSIFTQEPSGSATGADAIVPAAEAVAPELRTLTVSPAEAVAPATLAFTVETNAATSSIMLLDETGAVMRTTAICTPQGDGLLWQVSADVQSPYTGRVRVFLRDTAGTWSEGAPDCAITVR
ncbi:MAG: hypothetical protein GX418_11090, partial [Clostridiales bacterium]|nr:hypothetical protein [Clostridiales bacterium]